VCTVTWEQYQNGYRMLFNRDERVTRATGSGPRIVEHQGIRAIMPIDNQAGGSWIAVNDLGLGVCLINNYGAEQRLPKIDPPSRGKLVAELAFATNQKQALEMLNALNPQRFNPFDIFVFDSRGIPACRRWDGVHFSEANNPDNFAFSTGFDTEGVVGNRRQLYHQWIQEGWDLRDYHRSHIPRAGSYSVCMHREDAATQSMSEIRVESASVQMTYWPGPPCTTAAIAPVTLKRKQ